MDSIPRSLTVYVDVTNTCNLRCRMCYFRYGEVLDRRAVHMPVEDFAGLARQVLPYAHTLFLSASAEPLMHPYFADILAIASSYETEHLKFLTNGQLLTPHVSAACVQRKVTEVHVSIDGATPDTYRWTRDTASLARLVENLTLLSALKRNANTRLPVLQFNVTLMRRNVTELGALARLARSVGVERIACRHMIPYAGLGMEDQSLSIDRWWANRKLAQGIQDITAEGISVVQFPDLFGESEATHPPWWGWLPQEPSGVSASSPRGLWTFVPARYRWRLQAIRLQRAGQNGSDRPIGRIDEPAAPTFPFQQGLPLAGWALHREGISRVLVCRELLPGESPREVNDLGLYSLGQARIHQATRPDVAERYAHFPEAHRAGWTFHLSRDALPRTFDRLPLHVIAVGRDDRVTLLGSRTLCLSGAPCAVPLYCRKPFQSVYIDAQGHMFPHPDCQNVQPFGRLGRDNTFAEIWHNEAFTALRRRILEVRPPTMCRSCPDFINRNVDDPLYFKTRAIDRSTSDSVPGPGG